MWIRRSLGALLLLGVFAFTVAQYWHASRFGPLFLRPGWEWLLEDRDVVAPAGFLCVLGSALLLPDAVRAFGSVQRVIPVLVTLLVIAVTAVLLVLYGLGTAVVLLFSFREFEVAHLPDPGPYAAAVVEMRGPGEFDPVLWVMRRGSRKYERHPQDFSYTPCRWPVRVLRSPGKPRYLFVDSAGMAVRTLALGAEDSRPERLPADLESLRTEFGIDLAGISRGEWEE